MGDSTTSAPPRWRARAAGKVRRRLIRAGDAKDIRAGWNGRGERYLRTLESALADRWCAGSTEAVDWILSDIWVERKRRTLPVTCAALSLLVVGAVAGNPALAAAALPVLIASRTPTSWYESLLETLTGDEKRRNRLIERHGMMLPGGVLESDAATILLDGESPETRETALKLAREWRGDIASLLEVSRRLAS